MDSRMKGSFDQPRVRQVLIRLRDAVDAARSRLIVILIPDAIQLGRPELQVINIWLAQQCDHLGIAFHDVTRSFEEHGDFASLYLFPQDAHTSPGGNRLIAKSARSWLLKQLVQ